VSQTIEVESIRRLDIRAGEYLVVTLPADTRPEVIRRIRNQVRDCLPEGVKLMMVGDNVDLQVLCPSSPA
jgi:hypothetical protein